MNPNLVILSMPTYVGASGATAAATYSFFTSECGPPSQDRYIEYDVVKNQNGKFKWIYDNGPGWKKWSPFSIHCEEKFSVMVGATSALEQFDRLRALWEHPGILGMQAPDGTYSVHWADTMEKAFRVFPSKVGDTQEFVVVVQFEEAP